MKLIKTLSVIAIMLFTFNYSFSQVIIGIGSTKKYLYNYFRLTTVSDNHRYDKLNLLNGGDVMHCEIKFDDNTNCDVIYVYNGTKLYNAVGAKGSSGLIGSSTGINLNLVEPFFMENIY